MPKGKRKQVRKAPRKQGKKPMPRVRRRQPTTVVPTMEVEGTPSTEPSGISPASLDGTDDAGGL